MIVGMLVVLAVAWTFNARRAVRGNDAARSDASASNWRWRTASVRLECPR